MKSASSDPNLSLRARGLFAYYLEVGRVLSAEEMSASVPEGRDSIRSAISELIAHEYISRTKIQDKSGKWNTTLDFTDAWKTDAWDPVTDDGFSGAMYIDNSTTSISTNNSYKLKVLEVLRTSNTGKFSEFPKEKENEGDLMTWPTIEEPETPKRKTRFNAEAEDDVVGVVGKVVDHAAVRRAKYKPKETYNPLTAVLDRDERPEETWTTKDLIAEFIVLTEKVAPDVPAQVNNQYLRGWINKQVGTYNTPRIAVLKAMRMFFADPRLTRDAGIGYPMWRRFLAFYPTVHGIVTRVAETNYEDENTTAHKEKMIKKLRGDSEDV